MEDLNSPPDGWGPQLGVFCLAVGSSHPTESRRSPKQCCDCTQVHNLEVPLGDFGHDIHLFGVGIRAVTGIAFVPLGADPCRAALLFVSYYFFQPTQLPTGVEQMGRSDETFP